MAPILPPEHKSIPSGVDHVDSPTVIATVLVGTLTAGVVVQLRRESARAGNAASVQADQSVPLAPDDVHTPDGDGDAPMPFGIEVLTSASSARGDSGDLSWLRNNAANEAALRARYADGMLRLK
jgi:hypothetical protein